MGGPVIILTWEYPPRVVSPVAEYCKKMADFLSKKGKDVIVISYDDWNAGNFCLENDRLFVFYVGNVVSGTYNPLVWTLQMSTEIETKAESVIDEIKEISGIHCHDWLTIPSALVLKQRFDVPLYITFHSIEPVRVGGRTDNYIESIKNIERIGCEKADKIFVNNLWLKYQVMYHYSVSSDKIIVLNNDFEDLIEIYGGAMH